MQESFYISALIQYGLSKKLFEPCDQTYIINRILEILQLSEFQMEEARMPPLEEILRGLLDNAVQRGICGDDITSRDLFDTKLMGALTPAPREVRKEFAMHYAQSPESATDWFYRFSQDTDYIRRYRIQKDMRWMTSTEYGNLDITINLSKPEKDPKAIAAAKSAPQSSYPKCQLCLPSFLTSLNCSPTTSSAAMRICPLSAAASSAMSIFRAAATASLWSAPLWSGSYTSLNLTL